MSEFYLERGGIVIVDDVDLPILEAFSSVWRLWKWKPNALPVVVRDEYCMGTAFRVLLHREIATRIEPKISVEPKLYKVKSRNRDFLDVRHYRLSP